MARFATSGRWRSGGSRKRSYLAQQLPFALYQAATTAHAMADDELTPLGITSRHYGILARVGHPGPWSQGALAETLRVDRTTMVALMDDLERRGFVERWRDPDDRRRYAIRLTPTGEAIRDRATGALAACSEAFLKPLSLAEREQRTPVPTPRTLTGSEPDGATMQLRVA